MPRRRSDTMRAVDAVMPLVDEFNALDEGDKLTFLDLVDPLPDGHNHKSKKKASKKSSKSAQSLTKKSDRASGMAAQLNKSLGQQRAVTTKDDNYDPESERCTFPRDDRKICFLLPDHNVHHMKSAVGFHPFQSSSDVSTAPAPSPANGGAGSTTQNSEASAASAGAAAGGSSNG